MLNQLIDRIICQLIFASVFGSLIYMATESSGFALSAFYLTIVIIYGQYLRERKDDEY